MQVTKGAEKTSEGRLRRIGKSLMKYRHLHLMALPGLIFFLIFKYVPMYGLVIAFKHYVGAAGGFQAIMASRWVGLRNFQMFFQSIYFTRLLSNTLIISLYRILFFFPAPILLALLMNEIQRTWFKRTVQTVTYMPYFLSWVVVAGLMSILLSPDNGPINALRQLMGMQPVYFLAQKKYFRTRLVLSEIWKNVGYGSIVYLAAITSVDPALYEAARMDGAGKIQQIVHVTLPAISEIIAIMLILTVGRVLDDNFDQIFNLYSPATYEVADVFETYIYRTGITEGKFSYTAAVGLFKSAISLLLILVTNRVSKRLGSDGII